MKLNLPFEEYKLSGIRFHVNNELLFVENDSSIVAMEMDKFKTCNFSYHKKSRVKKIFQFRKYLYFVDNASILKPGLLLRVDLDDLSVEELGPAFFKIIVFVGKVEGDFVFSIDGKYFAKCQEDDISRFQMKKIFDKPFPINSPLICDDKIICVGMQREIACYNSCGEIVWRKDINQILTDINIGNHSAVEIGRCVKTYQDKIYFNLNSGEIVCVNSMGELIWRDQDIDVNRFCMDENGKIYVFYRNRIKVLDAISGNLLVEEVVGNSMLGNMRESPLLYFDVTSTHSWCAFSGKGLVAINLSNFEVDWCGFEGCTINRELKFKNNRLYLQVSENGLDIGSNSVCEYVFTGNGGHLQEIQNEIEGEIPF